MAASSTAWACSYKDPYADPSGYASWCSCVGGTLYRDSGNNPACKRGGSTPPPPPPDPADVAFRQADALQQAGDLAGAERYYLQTLAYNNRYAAAYNNLANIYRKWERYEKAVDHYVKAIQYATTNSDREAYRKNLRLLYLDRGAFYLNRKDYRAAESWFRSVLGMFPGDTDALSGLDKIRERQANSAGNARYDAKDYDGAIASYREALGYCHANCDYLHKNIAYAERDREANRAWQLFDRKDYDGAIAASERGLAYCRADMDCGYLHRKIAYAKRNRAGDRGNRLFDRKDYDAAIQAYEEALRFCQGDMDCDYLHKNIAAANQNKKNDRHKRENRRLAQEAKELAGAGDAGRAEKALRELVARNPNSAHHANKLGIHLLRQEKFRDAEAAFRNGLGINPNDAVLHYNLAVSLLEQGRHEEARQQAEASLAIDPSYEHAGQLLDSLKNRKLGQDAARLVRDGEPGQAESMLRQELDRNPDNAGAALRLGNFLMDQARYDDAEAAYRQGLEQHPDDTVMRYNLSLILKRAGRYDEAEQQLQKVLALDSSYRKARELLSSVQQIGFIGRHVDPVIYPVFNRIERSVYVIGSKRQQLAQSLRNAYNNIREQASSAQFHGHMAEGSAGETAKIESGKVFDDKGRNIGTTLDPLVVDGRQPEPPEALPEGLLNHPEWQRLDAVEKARQQDVARKEEEIANFEQMRSSPELSGLKKAMVLVAIAKVKEELFYAEHEVKVIQQEKEQLKISFSLGELTEVKDAASKQGEDSE